MLETGFRGCSTVSVMWWTGWSWVTSQKDVLIASFFTSNFASFLMVPSRSVMLDTFPLTRRIPSLFLSAVTWGSRAHSISGFCARGRWDLAWPTGQWLLSDPLPWDKWLLGLYPTPTPSWRSQLAQACFLEFLGLLSLWGKGGSLRVVPGRRISRLYSPFTTGNGSWNFPWCFCGSQVSQPAWLSPWSWLSSPEKILGAARPPV